MADYRIGVKPWLSYSSFSLLGGGQRSDRPMVLLVNHYSGNLIHSMTDFVLAARVTPIYTRTYNHQDVTASGVPRPHGYGFTTTFDSCIFAEDLDPATTDVTYKDATGSEYVFTWDSGNSVFISPVGLKKFTLTWSSGNSRYELDDGSHVLYFERNAGMTVAYLTRIRQKREYNNDYHALKINRVASGGYPTVQISTVQIHYYNTSGSAWADKTILTPTYKTSTNLIETWVLDDTVDGSNYKMYVKYTYSGDYLTDIQWFREDASTGVDLDMSTKYERDGSNLLAYISDSENFTSGTLKTSITYSSNKAYQITQKATTTNTPTTTFTYGLTSGIDMRDSTNNRLTKVTDPESNDWYYETEGTTGDLYDKGKLQRSADPTYNSSTNKNQVDYDWSSANYQMETITTGIPGEDGDESGTVETWFYYNANYDLTVMQDQLGFLTFFDYRIDPWAGTPDNTLQSKVHYIYTHKPNNDDLETECPASPSISTVEKDGSGYYYEDDSGTPKRIDLVASEMTYDANNNLTTSTTPLGNETTFSYNSDTGDLAWVRDPKQTDAADTDNQTDYTYNDIYGAVLTVTTAEPTTGATRSTSTTEYNATYTRATKVIRPASTDHYTTYTYNDLFFLTAVKRHTTVTKTSPPPDTTNVDLTVATYVYDKNGNTLEVYKLLPNLASTEAVYDSDSSSNRFKAQEFTYDGMNRMLTSVVYVTLDRSTRESFTTSYEYDLRSLVTKVTRPGGDYGGIKSEMTYDAAGRIDKTYDPYDASIVMNWPYTTPTYDKLGNVKMTQRFVYDYGSSQYVAVRETRFTLDYLSRVTMTERDVTEYDYSTNPPTETAVTLTTETTYDSAGNVRFNYTPEGTASATEYYTKNEYDDDGRLLKSYQPDVITSGTLYFTNDEREYDKNGNVTKYYDFESVAASKTYYAETRYDNLNRAVNNRVYNSNTSTTVVDWNEADTIFDLNGNVYRTWGKENGDDTTNSTERTYDLWDRAIEIEYPEVTDVDDDPVRYTESTTYNLDGGVNLHTDRNGNVPSINTYDELGRTIILTTSDGTTQYNYLTYYGDTGKVEHTEHPLGSKVIYTYDAQGRTTQVSRRDSAVPTPTTYNTDYTFNSTGELTQVDFSDGGQQKYTYDEIGRRRQTEVLYTTSPSSTYITTSVEFNKNGAAKKYWDGRGNASSTTFGLRGQTLTTTDPLSRTTTVTYDKNMRTTQVDAPDSKQSRTYYDEAGRVTSRRDYLVANTTYVSVAFEYDNNSQVTVTTDQNTNEWTKTYDAMGRHLTTVTPTVSSTEYTNTKWYDGNGNVVKVTDFNGADTTYTYNNSNQRTQISYIGAGGGGSDIDIDFDYNCCRMTGYDDTLGSGSVLVYDEFARLISHTDSQGYVLAYVYDSMNRVTKVTDHTSIDTEYAYDLMGRTSTVTYDPRGANRVTTYTYDGNSNVATATYANSYTSTFTYDAGNRTTQQKVDDTCLKLLRPSGSPLSRTCARNCTACRFPDSAFPASAC